MCTHNSARSQMAEALVNRFFCNKWIAFSAGTKPSGVNPYTIQVIEELGIDMKNHYSKSIEDLKENFFDITVTLCDSAKEECPFFSNTKLLIHKGFPDPSPEKENREETLKAFMSVRDQILNWLNSFLKEAEAEKR